MKTSPSILAVRLLALIGMAATVPSLLACLEHPLKDVRVEPQQEAGVTFELSVNKDVDILFVIEDSGSMTQQQANLARNFPAFIEVLEQEGVDANYRIAITTVDNGGPAQVCQPQTALGGRFVLSSCRSRPDRFVLGNADARAVACEDWCDFDDIEVLPTPVADTSDARPRPWIERNGSQTNLGAASGLRQAQPVASTDAMQCFGPQGINGCGYESTLESMAKALQRAIDPNEAQHGFLRDHAVLAIIFLTDEDDCSFKWDKRSIFHAPSNCPDGLECPRGLWSERDLAADRPFADSSVCWNAANDCETVDGSVRCRPSNKDIYGNVDVSDEEAVLHPVARYIELVQAIEDEKRRVTDSSMEVIVGLVAGVNDAGQAIYRDDPNDPFQQEFGIAPGCTSEVAQGVPPVRMLEFARHFQTEDEQNVFSVCAEDYTPALQAIARAIGKQVQPACFPKCVADQDPLAEGLQPECVLREHWLEDGEPQTRTISACVVSTTQDSWSYPDGKDVCYLELSATHSDAPEVVRMSETCRDRGHNLEFRIERQGPTPPGAQVEANCVLSASASLDCPDL